MDAATIARIEALEGNISRYSRLLATHVSDLERDYLHRRIAEDRAALTALLAPDDMPRVPLPSRTSSVQA